MADSKRFMILIFGTGEGMMALPEEERNAHMKKWYDWTEELKASGAFASGDPINPTAVTISGKDKVEKEGFFSENKDVVVGGYYTINADSMEAAVEIAKGCPTFELDGNVEVREIMDM